ncbi:MAG TPA: DUF4058 family protein, partial [Armatimonadota bacterium]|nr:DUF4058 family protein [Armatimonadota bacterium]
ERFVEVLHVPDRTLVAVIELASPTNNADPRGRKAYQGKQEAVLASGSHLVEIDLLRAGAHWAAVPEALVQGRRPYDYLACVNRASRRDVFECYFRKLREPLPAVAIPLLPEDDDVTLNIQEAFNRAYDQGRYVGWVDYRDLPYPPLRPEDEEWARAVLRDSGVIGDGTSGVTDVARGE